MNPTDPSVQAAKSLATDQQAITLLKQGSMAGLAALVQRYQAQAVHTALLIVRDGDLAEDIAQEAFLQAYQSIGQFDERRPFGPWFLRIVINASLKAAGRQKRSIPLEETEDDSAECGRIARWLIDPQPGPEELTETAEMTEMIWQALARLSPNQRAAVVLRYFLEKDEREMIQELNRPLTTVKWWLHAARERLRSLLRPDDLSEAARPEGRTNRRSLTRRSKEHE